MEDIGGFVVWLADHYTVIIAIFTAAGTGVAGWVGACVKIKGNVAKAKTDAAAIEQAERAAYRSTILEDLKAAHKRLAEREEDLELTRTKLNVANGDIVMLKATVEITKQRLDFWKERGAAE